MASPHYASAPYRLLIVENDQPILDLLGEVLAEEGARTTLADTLPRALEALDRERFDVILSDTFDRRTTDTVFDRWATLELVKAHAGTTPVLIFSAHPASAFAEAKARGFAGFIAKPFDLDVLAETVRICAASGAKRHRSVSTLCPDVAIDRLVTREHASPVHDMTKGAIGQLAVAHFV